MRNKNGYIFLETALGELQEYLDSKSEWYSERGDISSSIVEFFVEVKGTRVRIWFNYDKQIYGFDMLSGGSKTGKTLDALIPLFENYIKINTDLIPVSKLIALKLDDLLQCRSVFKTVSGNSTDGYTAVFNIIDSDGDVLNIRKVDETYIASVSDEEYEFKYEDDDVVLIENKDELSPFQIMLDGTDCKYKYNNTVATVKLDDCEVDLRDKGGTGVELIGCNLSGKVLGFLLENPVFFKGYNLKDITDILYEDFTDKVLLSLSLSCNYGVSCADIEITDDGKLLVEGNEINSIEDYINMPRLSGLSIEEPEGGTPEESPSKVTDATDTETRISKLIYNGEVVGVQIVRNSVVYSMDLETVKAFGLNTDRIICDTELNIHNGILVSVDELQLHKFAIKVVDSADVKKLFDFL